ncbi:MAG: hypothetical protein U1F43_01110 [Myxococcota bacterium]
MRPALGLLLTFALARGLAACGGEPCECRAPDAVAAASAAPAAPAAGDATAAAGPAPAPIAKVVGDSPHAQLALETLDEMLAKNFAPIRALMTDDLRLELTEAKLSSIVTGLLQAHGPVVQVMDAWSSTIKEKEVVMPASQVLMKMANDTRIGLMLVFDPNGLVKGLWLRPI